MFSKRHCKSLLAVLPVLVLLYFMFFQHVFSFKKHWIMPQPQSVKINYSLPHNDKIQKYRTMPQPLSVKINYSLALNDKIQKYRTMPQPLSVKINYSLALNDKIQIFVDEIRNQKMTIFLMEPNILLALINNKTSKLSEHRFITFGVKTDTVPNFQNIEFPKLKHKGFEVLKVNGFPSRADLDQKKLSHIFLYHELEHLLLHLVVFYNRGDNFIWNDRLQLDKPPDWLKIEQLRFGHNASGFNKLELTEVKLGNFTLSTPSNINKFVNRDIPVSTFIECNMTRVNEFYTANPKLNNTPAGRSQNARASKLLKALKATMDEIGVRYWLSSGTLLGWYRQCEMISFTNDMDVEVYVKDFTPAIKDSFKSHGFRQIQQFGRLNDSFEMTFRKDGLILDVFYIYEERDHNWCGGVEKGNGVKFRFTFPKITLCWGELLGVAVRVPCDTLTYLIAVYGAKWAEPTKGWYWAASPKNIKRVGQWTRKEMKETVQIMG